MAIDNLIDSVSLYKPRHIVFHGAIFPFVVLYASWTCACIYAEELTDLYFIGIFAIGVTQALCSLCCYWSVSFRCLLSCQRVKSPQAAAIVKVIPTPNNGFTELVLLNSFKNQDQQTISWFRYQEIKYVWNDDKKCFHSLDFPISNTIEEYVNCKGYNSDEQLARAVQLYGQNRLNIQLPKFNDLFIERATAPFFVFQVFCIALWCFDKYWYYSLFTLAMLVLFECTLVKQQLRNMEEIRNMGNQPITLYVYRNKKWQSILSDKLTPGDIVSITRANNDQTVPCDLLLLRGSCIVDESLLTGESIPQMKEPIENIADYNRHLDFESDKKLHILFSGTKVVQHTSPIKTSSNVRASPDNGCIAYVLRTGFNTSQGNLLQTILFGVKHVTANNMETLAFILFLLIFAVAAAYYLWIKGTEDPNRSRYKLFLECTLILTSVIPPELPVELSLAVNSSILSLSKLGIYCTEPFRIPFAGKIEICCFDKTGTLTKDALIVEGIAGIEKEMMPMIEAPEHTIQVLASCHSLVQLEDTLVGDPIEKASLKAINWILSRNDFITPKKSKIPPLKILSRFYFSSSLKRMSVLAAYKCTNKMIHIASVKGAPEVLKSMLQNIPNNYDSTYLDLAGRGARVLALARKEMSIDPNNLKSLKREDLECDLNFVGFVVVSCPLKQDSENVIKELLASSHMVTMITGDNALTACYVANELNFTRSSSRIILTLAKVENKWCWVSDSYKIQVVLLGSIRELVESYDLCLTGEGLAYLNQNHREILKTILPHVCVFARVAPKEKEFIIVMLKELGYSTLMCGDGTNDVGALKHAHVGIAILAKGKEKMKIKKDIFSNKSRKPGENVGDQMKRLMKEMDEESVTVVKSGDASIAAPFTSKFSSVTCVCHVIKQGRCTLVTTLQMFKILALNALIAAYSQSVLYVKGIKFSDSQATLQGLLLAASFLFISRSKPLKVLSKQRPLPNIFNVYTISTVLLQFIIHFCSLVYLVQEAGMYAEDDFGNTTSLSSNDTLLSNVNVTSLNSTETDVVDEFKPNVVNSAVFIISMALQISTFSVNYRGRPFMENLVENKPLLYSTLGTIMVILCLSVGVIEGLNEQFEIVQFPYEFRVILISVLVIDYFGSYIMDRLCLWLFGEGKFKKVQV